MIVSEGLGGVPTSSMKNVALTNAKKLDPDARVVFEERRVINGRELLYLEMEVTGQGIPFRFTGYYHGGTKSNLQVIGYTVRGEFEATRKGSRSSSTASRFASLRRPSGNGGDLTSEILIMPDGRVLAHNLTPVFTEMLS